MFKKILFYLNILHKSFISKKNYYSFSGVDVLINDIFKKQESGFYLDIGCQHPIKNNNSYKKMAYLPINGLEDSTFQIKAEIINFEEI